MTTQIVQENGGIFIELMVDSTGNPMQLVDDWVSTYDLNGSVMHDKDGVSRDMLKDGADREWAFIVDLATMQIVWREFGSTGGGGAVEDYAAVLGLVEICKASYLNCP